MDSLSTHNFCSEMLPQNRMQLDFIGVSWNPCALKPLNSFSLASLSMETLGGFFAGTLSSVLYLWPFSFDSWHGFLKSETTEFWFYYYCLRATLGDLNVWSNLP